jgi:hypothetical protein
MLILGILAVWLAIALVVLVPLLIATRQGYRSASPEPTAMKVNSRRPISAEAELTEATKN